MIFSKKVLLPTVFAVDPKGLEHRLEPLMRVHLKACRGDLQHPARAVRNGLAIAIEAFREDNRLELRYRAVKRVIDQYFSISLLASESLR